MNFQFDMSSPKARAMGQYIATKSIMRSLYSNDPQQLCAMTPDQRPDVMLDFTRTTACFHGQFNFGSRAAYRALTGKRGPAPIICTYAIEHTASGATYVGSSENLFRRWDLHLARLRRGGHKNRELQELFDRDGANAFTIRILRSFDTVNGLMAAEITDSLRFKNLLNVRIGNQFVENWSTKAIFRTTPYEAKKPRGPQTKARWYDGTGTGARS